jgi:hypothetical protein
MKIGMKIGKLTKWQNIKIGEFAGFRTKSDSEPNRDQYGMIARARDESNPLPSSRIIVLSKEDWQIDPDHSGVTYLQGITREIDPAQDVIYLGKHADLVARLEFIRQATKYAYPVEND